MQFHFVTTGKDYILQHVPPEHGSAIRKGGNHVHGKRYIMSNEYRKDIVVNISIAVIKGETYEWWSLTVGGNTRMHLIKRYDFISLFPEK